MDFQLILVEIGVLVHPQLGLRFGAAMPFFIQPKNNTLPKNMILYAFQMIFYKNGPNLQLTRRTTIKTGILTPVEFWWVP